MRIIQFKKQTQSEGLKAGGRGDRASRGLPLSPPRCLFSDIFSDVIWQFLYQGRDGGSRRLNLHTLGGNGSNWHLQQEMRRQEYLTKFKSCSTEEILDKSCLVYSVRCVRRSIVAVMMALGFLQVFHWGSQRWRTIGQVLPCRGFSPFFLWLYS